MRIFKDHLGIEWDLDDEKIYKNYPKNTQELHNRILREVGYCHVYFTYFHTDWDKSQIDRVNTMIKEYTENWLKGYKYRREFLFKFECEIENMC